MGYGYELSKAVRVTGLNIQRGPSVPVLVVVVVLVVLILVVLVHVLLVLSCPPFSPRLGSLPNVMSCTICHARRVAYGEKWRK